MMVSTKIYKVPKSFTQWCPYSCGKSLVYIQTNKKPWKCKVCGRYFSKKQLYNAWIKEKGDE